jgi:hypothetical protein
MSTTLVTTTLVVAAVALVFVCSPSPSSSLPTTTTTTAASALSRAQQLQAPAAKLAYGGEAEHNEWWDEHEDLLQQARKEWGRLHPELYELDDHFRTYFLNPDLVRSLSIESQNKQLFASLFWETAISGVYTLQLFTPSFTQLLIEELAHQEASGIPLRRPNGMNRYGAILSDLGFSDMMDRLVADYLVVAARHLFPNHVGPNDISQSYPFTVQYQPGQDVQLAEHTDASTVTVNICLQPADHDTPVLYFKEQLKRHALQQPDNVVEPASPRAAAKVTYIDLTTPGELERALQPEVVAPTPPATEATYTYIDLATPGQAVLHLGQHAHGVSDVGNSTSLRQQLVVWLFGAHGYVRVAPYTPQEVEAHVRAYELFWNASLRDGTSSSASATTAPTLPGGDGSEL